MAMFELLFSTSGKIGRIQFQKGAVVLLAINFFSWLFWYAGLGIGLLAAFASLILIYCWGCLFVKRLRAANKPGIWFLGLFAIFAFSSYILSSMFLAILSPEIVQEMLEFQKTVDPYSQDISELLPFYDRVFRAFAIPYASAYLIAGAILAFIVNKNLDSDIP